MRWEGSKALTGVRGDEGAFWVDKCMCKGPVVCREEDAEPSRNQKEASVAAIKLIVMQSRGGGLW